MSSNFLNAQTYFKNLDFEEALKEYKKVIQENIDPEEVWYSMFQASKIYLMKNNLNLAQNLVMKSFNLNRKRAENLYLLTNYFRNNGDNRKAYFFYNLAKDIPKPDKGLFIDENVYNYLFQYELTILYYYISSNRKEGLHHCIKYLNLKNKGDESGVYNNLHYYLEPLKDKENTFYLEYNLPSINNYFIPSSPSLIQINDNIIMNIRHVSYKLCLPNAYYWTPEWKHGRQLLKTLNVWFYVDENLNIISDGKHMNTNLDDLKPIESSCINGLEDLRLIEFNNKVYYFATSNEYTHEIKIIHDEYDYKNGKFINNKIMNTPHNKYCEKNWTPIIKNNELQVIYEWYPLTFAKINNNMLDFYEYKETPLIFRYFKGSTPFVQYNNELWCVVHSTIETQPRVYLHYIVVFDKDYNLLRYSLPFSFIKNNVEFCLGFIIKNKTLFFTFSQFDCNPTFLKTHLDNITFISP
jgi:hypothetical protein